jgi:hypothetical protein
MKIQKNLILIAIEKIIKTEKKSYFFLIPEKINTFSGIQISKFILKKSLKFKGLDFKKFPIFAYKLTINEVFNLFNSNKLGYLLTNNFLIKKLKSIYSLFLDKTILLLFLLFEFSILLILFKNVIKIKKN